MEDTNQQLPASLAPIKALTSRERKTLFLSKVQDSPPKSLLTLAFEDAVRRVLKPTQAASASAFVKPAGGRSKTV
jgi:hypothetical protein